MFGITSRLGQIFLKLLGMCYCLPISSVLCFSIIHTYLQVFMLRFHAFCFVLNLKEPGSIAYAFLFNYPFLVTFNSVASIFWFSFPAPFSSPHFFYFFPISGTDSLQFNFNCKDPLKYALFMHSWYLHQLQVNFKLYWI